MLRNLLDNAARAAYSCSCALNRVPKGAAHWRSIHTTSSLQQEKYVKFTGEFKHFEVEDPVGNPHLRGCRDDHGHPLPLEETLDTVIDGVPFNQTPIINVKTTKNNTIINVTDTTGRKILFNSSAGIEGFKNAKKGTTVGAQAAALSVGGKLFRKGMKNVRVTMQGLGQGRLPSLQGLVMSGVKVLSITDKTKINHGSRRPRKAKRAQF